MRDVAIIGAGITPCKGRWVEKTYYGLAQMAAKEAIADAGISIKAMASLTMMNVNPQKKATTSKIESAIIDPFFFNPMYFLQ